MRRLAFAALGLTFVVVVSAHLCGCPIRGSAAPTGRAAMDGRSPTPGKRTRLERDGPPLARGARPAAVRLACCLAHAASRALASACRAPVVSGRVRHLDRDAAAEAGDRDGPPAGGLCLLALLVWLCRALAPGRRAGGRAHAGAAALALAAARGADRAGRLGQRQLRGAGVRRLAAVRRPGCRRWISPRLHLVRELGKTDDGELLPLAALIAIHWSHRMLRWSWSRSWAWPRIVRASAAGHWGGRSARCSPLQFATRDRQRGVQSAAGVAVAHNAGAAACSSCWSC